MKTRPPPPTKKKRSVKSPAHRGRRRVDPLASDVFSSLNSDVRSWRKEPVEKPSCHSADLNIQSPPSRCEMEPWLEQHGEDSGLGTHSLARCSLVCCSCAFWGKFTCSFFKITITFLCSMQSSEVIEVTSRQYLLRKLLVN